MRSPICSGSSATSADTRMAAPAEWGEKFKCLYVSLPGCWRDRAGQTLRRAPRQSPSLSPCIYPCSHSVFIAVIATPTSLLLLFTEHLPGARANARSSQQLSELGLPLSSTREFSDCLTT